ncbi:MAG: pseudouridine-5'-phosphate glycosidase, partial [Acidobacteriota bacterium]|nr:pseudouridine-5'-phosphate glycosidase [Acidobacteriota bacterium]
TGKDTTPFLLDFMHTSTHGTSVEVNLEIVRTNCRLAAEIASAYASTATA